MADNKYIRLNIAFLPPSCAAQSLTNLSQKLAKDYQTFFVLGGRKVFSHISIYSPLFPSKNINKVLARTGEVVKKVTSIQTSFTGLKCVDGYLVIGLRKTREMTNFHKVIVNSLNPYRESSLRTKYRDHWENYNGTQKVNIVSFGVPYILNLYYPHITITRFKNDSDANKAVKSLTTYTGTVILNKIAVFTMGEHGTCTRLIKSWTLPKVRPQQRFDLKRRR